MLRIDGTSFRGTAWLEHRDLVFRGSTRLAIPLSTITSAKARDGVLTVRFGERSAEFEIGDAAPKWAARIANPPSRLDKLGVKAGMRVVVVGMRDPVFLDELSRRGAHVLSTLPSRSAADMLFFAAQQRRGLERLSVLKGKIQPAGAIWVVRPKGRATITESDTMSAGRRAGLVDVKVVSFSDTLTAEKFVIPVSKRPNRRGA